MRPLDAAASSSPSSPDVPAQPAPQPARPDTARSSALARLAQRYDLRARPANALSDEAPGPLAPVEHAFRCDLPRLDCIAALREAWARAAVQAVPLPTGDVPGDDTPIVTASLWPAPMTALSGRRATIAALGRQAGAPGLWEVASGALIDVGVPPGTVRLTLLGTLELELELEAVRRPDAEGAAAEPGPVAQTAVAVAAFDLVERPGGTFGRVQALQPCWEWVEALAHEAFGAAWQWADARDGGDGAAGTEGRPARARAGAGHGAAPHGQEQTEQLRALQAAYVTQCRAYAEAEDRTRDARNKNRKTPAAPRRPTLREFAESQQMSEATLRRLLRRLGATWGKDFKSLPLAVDTLED